MLLFPSFIVSIDVTKEEEDVVEKEEWGREDLFEWKKMVLNTRVYTDKEGRKKIKKAERTSSLENR